MTKRFICFILTAICCLTFSLTAFAANSAQIPNERLLPRLNDGAGLLSASEAQQLTSKLDTLSEKYGFDIVIVTVTSLNGQSPESFSFDYYDYNGFGYGENGDGVLLTVSMENRDWLISTTGYGKFAINTDGINYIGEEITDYLSDGEYYTAFDTFAKLCEDFVVQANTGEPYTKDTLPKRKLSLLWIPGSVMIGMLISFLIMNGFKSQLKSVRRAPSAREYQVPGSMLVTEQSDMFLYSHVSRVPRQTQSGNKGGVRTGSSGRSHGSGGGKF